MKNNLSQLSIVLARPKHSSNIGAVARVAANFQTGPLIIAGPRLPFNYDEAAPLAMGPAKKYLDQLIFKESLQQAIEESLQDSHLIVGLSRREGRQRTPELRFSDVAERILKGQTVTMVYGSEEGGLNREEVNSCHGLLRIPTAEVMPAMNLSHAVAVATAELFRLIEIGQAQKQAIKKSRPHKRQEMPLTEGEWQLHWEQWQKIFKLLGPKTWAHREQIINHLKGMLLRAQAKKIEGNNLLGLLTSIERKLHKASDHE